jgi:probable F420-dependent oxidoreductase
VHHWQALHYADPRELVLLGRVAEDLGYTGIALDDHLVLPDSWDSRFPYSSTGRVRLRPETMFPDPWVTFGALASQTEHLRFATWVYILALRDIFSVAKSIATVDHLAPGRTLFGVGLGWLAEEYDAAQVPFHTRGRLTDEMLEGLRTIWQGGPATYTGEQLAFRDVHVQPTPLARIPICVGGHSRAALRRAARHDGWFVRPSHREHLADDLLVLRGLREQEGRADQPFTVMVMVPLDTDHSECERLEEIGVTDVVFGPPCTDSLTEIVEAMSLTVAGHDHEAALRV